MPSTTGKIRDSQRARLAQALINSVRDEGVPSASVEELASRVGIVPEEIGHLYTTKDELLHLAAEEMLHDRTALWRDLGEAAPVPPPDAALELFLSDIPDAKATADALLQIWGESVVMPQLRDSTSTSMERLHQAIGEYLVAWFGQSDNEDPEGVAWACAPVILSLAQGFIMQVSTRGQMDPARYVAGVRVLLAEMGSH
ncbi:TetR family transcriptional regulator C-terminal domain-containing protein [Dietzia timorensis]|uniref:BetI-type transcriptional repressor C-terminal domain-containing protein n=1 Tax=Dietzia timorensis TaxID=499555 RepID=A0A173LNM8_9ACTN|nr:TetR family transcriptional regulator C-terminal domain-containing protein [Dietzia timorensis]ANI93238.1 Hypothetical protein BJL86_2474 [Dietzia timorensis]